MRKFGYTLVILLLAVSSAQAKPMPFSPKAKPSMPTTAQDAGVADSTKKDAHEATKKKLAFLHMLLTQPLEFSIAACEKLKGKLALAEMTEDNQAWLDCDSRFAVLADEDKTIKAAVVVAGATASASLAELKAVLGPASKVDSFQKRKITSWRMDNILLTYVESKNESPVLFITEIPENGDVDDAPNYNTL